jgi:hypothetical protein
MMRRILDRLGIKEKWRHQINYAIRNIDIGDGEDTRLWEDPDEFCRGFREEGVPHHDVMTIRVLLCEAKHVAYPHYDEILAEVHKLLFPHISHKELYKNDYDRWEWQTWNDPEEWGDYEEWMNDA